MKITRLTPWFTEGAILEIDRRLSAIKKPSIFEFGMGASTLYWIKYRRIKTKQPNDLPPTIR